MDTTKTTAREPHDDSLEAHFSCLERPRAERPHACMGGLVFIGHLVEEDGEEVEVVEEVPCRRCAAWGYSTSAA